MASVRITGLDGLLDAMKRLPPELISKGGGPAKLAMKAGATVIRDEAASRVAVSHTPGDNVHVRDNVVVKRDGNPRRSGPDVTERFEVRVRGAKRQQPEGTGTRNWGALEFGNEHQAAKPFLRPAFESRWQEALSVITDKLRAGIEKVASKVGKA